MYAANAPGFVYCEPDEPRLILGKRIDDAFQSRTVWPKCFTCGDHGYLCRDHVPIPCPSCTKKRNAPAVVSDVDPEGTPF